MSEWTTAHRASAVETFFKWHESYVTTIRAFRKHFAIQPRKPVPTETTVRLWVRNFREKESVNKTKPPGPKQSVRTPQNIERVRVAFQNSPRRSVRKHAASMNINERTLRRIHHEDLNFHPYKMLITQQLLPTEIKIDEIPCLFVKKNVPTLFVSKLFGNLKYVRFPCRILYIIIIAQLVYLQHICCRFAKTFLFANILTSYLCFQKFSFNLIVWFNIISCQ